MKRILIYIIALLVSAGVVYTCSRVPGCRTAEDGKWRDVYFLKDLNIYVMVDASDTIKRVYFSNTDSGFNYYVGHKYAECSYIQYYFPGGDTIVITDINNEIKELEAQNFQINHVKGTIGPIWKQSNGVVIKGEVLSDSSIFSKPHYTLTVSAELSNEICLWNLDDSLIYSSTDSLHSGRHGAMDAIIDLFGTIKLPENIDGW